jgi:hypothetical protein
LIRAPAYRAEEDSVPEDPVYTLHFEWPEGHATGATPRRELDAENEAQARMQAALIYAGTSFEALAPSAYRIVGPDGATVYRYPEMPDSSDEPRPWPADVPLPGQR